MIASRLAGDPGAPARAVVVAYLLFAVVMLVVGASAGRVSPAATLLPVALSLVATGVSRARREDGLLAALRDWLPLLLLPVLYAELPTLIAALGRGYQDPIAIGWERALFGTPARTLAARFPSRALSETLHAGYLSYYPLIYLPPLFLWLRRRTRDFGESVLAVTLAYVACFVVFVVFPVQGPRYLWSGPLGVPEGPIRSLARRLLAAGSSRGAAFPSSHAAVAVAQAVTAVRHHPRGGWIAALSAATILVGAVYAGFHYAIDMTVGCLVGVACAGAAVAMRSSPRRAPDSSRTPRAPRPA